jgi:hypothetical protein
MDCFCSLCNKKNPHGFCGDDSCLFKWCTFPFLVILAIIASPIWFPLAIVCSVIDECENCIEWDKNNKNEYTKIENVGGDDLIKMGNI